MKILDADPGHRHDDIPLLQADLFCWAPRTDPAESDPPLLLRPEIRDHTKVGPVATTPRCRWGLLDLDVGNRLGPIGQMLDDPIHEASNLGQSLSIELVHGV